MATTIKTLALAGALAAVAAVGFFTSGDTNASSHWDSRCGDGPNDKSTLAEACRTARANADSGVDSDGNRLQDCAVGVFRGTLAIATHGGDWTATFSGITGAYGWCYVASPSS